MAGSPAALADAGREQRRRWVMAAAASGLLLTAPGAGATASAATGLTRELREQLEPELTAIADAVDDDTGGPPGTARARRQTVAPVATVRPPSDLGQSAVPVAATGDTDADDADDAADVTEVARLGDVRVVTEDATTELVGFHENNDVAALDLEPATDLHEPEPDGADAEAEVPIQLPTRGRAGGPTSAVDVAVTTGEPVASPLSGEVVEVADFALYGSTRDLLVRIRSDEDPSVVATVFHLDGARVAVGDHVEAGATVIADEARQLPFESQIDRFTAAVHGDAAPHYHLEFHHA
jgi:murein DD-endopeptidase MepM/ murein hydrolase activator NlpD